MAVNGYTIGKSVTIQISDNYGVAQTFAMRTRFTSHQMTNQIKVKRFDGNVDFLELPDGWGGSFDYTRRNANLDAYIAKLETDYYNGVDINPAQITETIVELGGTATQWRYTGVMFKLSDAGDKIGDDVIKQKLDFVASRRFAV